MKKMHPLKTRLKSGFFAIYKPKKAPPVLWMKKAAFTLFAGELLVITFYIETLHKPAEIKNSRLFLLEGSLKP